MNDQAEPARIGPNAIIRVAEALIDRYGPTGADAVFVRADQMHYLAHPPERMVPETDVMALHRALRDHFSAPEARAIAFDAGERTGDYLLAHRIPMAAQRILRLLPARSACRALLGAVARHAWTFSGSGHYRFEMTRPVRVTIADCPLSRGARASEPVCDFYAGAFTRLCQRLVKARASVRETHCQACGDAACVFEISW